MGKKVFSRRDFLKGSALATAGAFLAHPAVSRALTSRAAQAAQSEVTLEFVTGLSEYANGYRQLLDIYELENPGVKVNLTTYNEDTEAAYLARVAGGFLPAMEEILGNSGRRVNRSNYQEWEDLSQVDFPYFDRWTWDIENTWPERFGLPGPRTLDPFQGIVVSFIYHKDIMDDIGWDPQTQVRTLEDLANLLDDMNRYVEEDPELQFGWDRGWINGFMYLRYMNLVPVAYEDGSREAQLECWMGRLPFNAPDSPYRHTFEYTRTALENGWNTPGWWNREWEADQEGTFISKRSVMLLHGPWLWDKALAANPDLELLGFPLPSEDGEDTVLHMEEPAVDFGWAIRAGNRETEYWEQTKNLFNWWHSPQIIQARAQIEGRNVLYELDEPLELDAPQFTGLLQKVGQGDWSHVRIDDGPWGRGEAAPYKIGGEPGPWDLATGSYNDVFVAAITGEIEIQEALDIAQENYERSYELPATE